MCKVFHRIYLKIYVIMYIWRELIKRNISCHFNGVSLVIYYLFCIIILFSHTIYHFLLWLLENVWATQSTFCSKIIFIILWHCSTHWPSSRKWTEPYDTSTSMYISDPISSLWLKNITAWHNGNSITRTSKPYTFRYMQAVICCWHKVYQVINTRYIHFCIYTHHS